jgi:FtsP/CotA-like multicopper oxidase with cupredoxin domain
MQFIRFGTSAVALVALLASAGTSAIATPATITIQMKALNGSNENGTAQLTTVPGGTQVVIKLQNGTSTPQPTHIHIGTCAKINAAPEYPLSNTVNGEGTSVVKGVSIADLLKQNYAINVHKSADDLGTYVSCGTITAGS